MVTVANFVMGQKIFKKSTFGQYPGFTNWKENSKNQSLKTIQKTTYEKYLFL